MIVIENGHSISNNQKEFVKDLFQINDIDSINLTEFLNNELKSIEFIINELKNCINELEQSNEFQIDSINETT